MRKLVSSNEVIEEGARPPAATPGDARALAHDPRECDRARGRHAEAAARARSAAEHAAIGLMPLIATCDRWDLGSVSTPLHPDTRLTTIFIHDAYPGGAGIDERDSGTSSGCSPRRSRRSECARAHGCPSCVQSPKCGNGNEPLDKQAAASLLAAILGTWGLGPTRRPGHDCGILPP